MNAELISPCNAAGEQGHGGGMRILLADDHEMVRRGLKHLLTESFGDVVFGEAGSAAEALEHAWKETWDLIVLDINMPGRSGLEVLTEFRNKGNMPRVLVFSVSPEEECAIQVLKMGAMGYLSKQSGARELVAAVTKVLAGGRYITATVAEQLAADLAAPLGKEPRVCLSQREAQVLRLIASGSSVKEIAVMLHLSEKTVFTYRDRIRIKLAVKNDVELTRYALRHRLVESP